MRCIVLHLSSSSSTSKYSVCGIYHIQYLCFWVRQFQLVNISSKNSIAKFWSIPTTFGELYSGTIILHPNDQKKLLSKRSLVPLSKVTVPYMMQQVHCIRTFLKKCNQTCAGNDVIGYGESENGKEACIELPSQIYLK